MNAVPLGELMRDGCFDQILPHSCCNRDRNAVQSRMFNNIGNYFRFAAFVAHLIAAILDPCCSLHISKPLPQQLNKRRINGIDAAANLRHIVTICWRFFSDDGHDPCVYERACNLSSRYCIAAVDLCATWLHRPAFAIGPAPSVKRWPR